MRVLVADDDPSSIRMVRSTLRKLGLAVVIADTGDEAWEILSSSNRPRLAILDWLMPGITGLEICRRLRDATDNSRLVYKILITGRTRAEDVAMGLEAGADDYIRKPINAEELAARVISGLRILSQDDQLARVNQIAVARQDALEEIFEYSPVAMLLLRPNLRIQAANEAARKLVGLQAEQAKVEGIGDLLNCKHCEEHPKRSSNGSPCTDCARGCVLRDALIHGTPIIRREVWWPLGSSIQDKCLYLTIRHIRRSREPLVLLSLEDITELKAITSSLSEANGRLENAHSELISINQELEQRLCQ